MKINNYCHSQNKKIYYTGGLTKQMVSEISNVNTNAIEHYMNHQGINVDFANNKFVAWSVLKTTELIKSLNKNFHLKIDFPENIFVKNFSELLLGKDFAEIYGITNFLPCRLYKNNDNIMPAKTIIFNKEFPWHMIDEISDYDYYKMNNTTSDFFLESFIHEFSHIAHEGHLSNKYGINNCVNKIVALNNANNNTMFKAKYGNLAKKNICNYAETSLFDLIACDISKRIIEKLDRNSIKISQNPFKNSPYNSNLLNLFSQKKPFDKFIKKIYNGNTSMLND